MKTHLMQDVVWFARQPITTAKKFVDDPGFEDYILRTRMNNLTAEPEIVLEQTVAYPLNEVLPIGSNYIYLMFQCDRYSELEPQIQKYRCLPTTVTIQCATTEEFEQKKKALFESHLPVCSKESTLEIQYLDMSPATFTVGEILNHIHRFYTTAMTKTELDAVASTDDGFGYSQKALRASEENTILYREEIMGDCMHFEGLRLIGHKESYPVYKILFGS